MGPGRDLTLPALLTAGLLLMAPAGAWAAPRPEERVLRIEAGDFAFRPSELRVGRGDRVTIELVATDFVHGLYLEGYDLDLVADPGETARLTFVADRPGTFRFRCSVPCGRLHPFMTGRLLVGPSLFPAGILIAVAAVAIGGIILGRPRPE